MNISINGNSSTISGNGNVTVNTANGVTTVIVDGKTVGTSAEQSVKVEVTGDVHKLDCTTCVINGNVKGDIDGTTILVKGDVGGSIDGTTINIEGNVRGNVDGTTIKCASISGNINM